MENDQKDVLSFVVDNREISLIDALHRMSIDVEIKIQSMDIADIQITYNNYTLLIERKTVADLAASIKDGRSREQKARLMSTRALDPSVRLLYIIEGSLPEADSNSITCFGVTSSAIHSFHYNTLFRDNIFVITTNSVQHTACVIKSLTTRIKSKGLLAPLLPSNQDDYTSLIVKTRKKDNVNVSTCLVMQLSSIPGISSKKAMSIINALNVESLCGLFNVLQDSSVAASKLSQVQGIGNMLAKTIVQFLYGDKNLKST